MAKGKYTGLIEESNHTPMQGTAATVDPAANQVTHFPVQEVLDYGKEIPSAHNTLLICWTLKVSGSCKKK